MKVKKWKKLSSELKKYGHRVIEKVEFLLPDGRKADYYLKKEKNAVCVLGLTPENKVVLCKQYRQGPDKILFELPGGGVESGESHLKAAKREFLEETGMTGDFKFVAKNYACAYSTLVRYNYVALNCKKVSDLKLDENEFIEVIEISLEDFRQHLRSGQLTDVEVGYLGLDYLGLL